MLQQKKKRNGTFRAQVALTLLVGGMLALVIAPAPPANARRFSDWTAPVNLGPVINSAFNDSQMAISKDDLSLYFSSTRPGGLGGVDMYVSQRSSVDDPWGPPMNLGPTVNTSSSEANPAFSRDGHFMFFQSDRPGGLGGIDIWVSWRKHKRDDFGWQPPVNLGAGVNSTVTDNTPSYFENDDGQGCERPFFPGRPIRACSPPQLYFASNRPGGLGSTDLYMSEQAPDGSFGPAVLVTELSSPLTDARPSIRHDGLEIFLHSDRLGSNVSPTGSLTLDLWVATRASTLDAWSTPVNLGNTMNSAFLEQHPYLSSDGSTLFFTSDRPGGFGGPDIYMSTREKARGGNDDSDDDDDN